MKGAEQKSIPSVAWPPPVFLLGGFRTTHKDLSLEASGGNGVQVYLITL